MNGIAGGTTGNSLAFWHLRTYVMCVRLRTRTVPGYLTVRSTQRHKDGMSRLRVPSIEIWGFFRVGF